jgi:hypothetical protein
MKRQKWKTSMHVTKTHFSARDDSPKLNDMDGPCSYAHLSGRGEHMKLQIPKDNMGITRKQASTSIARLLDEGADSRKPHGNL